MTSNREDVTIYTVELCSIFLLGDELMVNIDIPVIPNLAYCWIRECKINLEFKSFTQAFNNCLASKRFADDLASWIFHEENEDKLALAWLMYPNVIIKDVKVEKLYRVALPDRESNASANLLALRRTEDGRIVINKVKYRSFMDSDSVRLFEHEIKRNHDYLWQFAEEVVDK